MMKGWCLVGIWAIALGIAAQVESVVIRSRAPNNPQVTVYYRVPKNYDGKRQESYRVMVIFGGRNNTGKADAGGRLGWGPWADELGIFLVSPGFKDDNYWEPREWSGKVLASALSEIKKKYNIHPEKMLFYGYSAGSQCSNLFPAWRPEWARAWVSHACGVFHEPNARMRTIPGLVTCGDADISRYIISRNFVENSRKKGVNIIWKSFPNHPHDVPPDSLKLARAFLGYYHTLFIDDLRGFGGRNPRITNETFIGDDLENTYYPAASPKARNILPEDRVYLPSQELADAWGRGE